MDQSPGIKTSEGAAALITISAPVVAALAKLEGWQLIAALGIAAAVAIAYGGFRTWLKAKGVAALLVLALLCMGGTARADKPPVVHLAYVEPSAAQLAADTRAQPTPTPEAVTPTDAQKAAAVIAALGAAAQNAQAGLANAPPVVKAWTETRAGQIVMGCIAGAIIVTSAAGAAAGVIVSLQ
jgi:hypothetical protein